MTRQPELYAGLSEADTAALTAIASTIRVDAGDVLFRIGDPAASLYLVENGRIELSMPMQVAGHDEEVRVEERSTGQTLGWSTLVPPHRFILNATAAVTTDLLAFPRDTLLAHFAARPDVGYVVLGNVAAIVGQRLQVFQTMWLRQMQRMVNLSHA